MVTYREVDPVLAGLLDRVTSGRDGAPTTSSVGTGWVLVGEGPDGRVAGAGGVDGFGRPVEVDSRFHVYCAVEPLLALAAAVLVVDGELSWDDRLGELIDDLGEGAADVTVSELLTHRSGICRPNPLEVYSLGRDGRRAAALAAIPIVPSLGAGESLYTAARSIGAPGEQAIITQEHFARMEQVAFARFFPHRLIPEALTTSSSTATGRR